MRYSVKFPQDHPPSWIGDARLTAPFTMTLGRPEDRSSIVFAAALTMALIDISGCVFASDPATACFR